MDDYFNFNKRDRNAILLLVAIILIIAVVKFFVLPKFETTDNAVGINEIKRKAKNETTFSSKQTTDENEDNGTISEKNYAQKTIEINIDKPFDPNSFSFDNWLKIGLPEKFCKTISHYQEKGGKFRKPEDLKKVWGMKEEWFEKIAPFIQINIVEKIIESNSTSTTNGYVPRRKSIVEINSADSLQFDSLPLIGMKTANRIIKYRNLLGGFFSVEQLKEVWGFKDSMLLVNVSRLRVDNSFVKKINVNTATIDELKKHPYLHYQKANAVFNYRKNHGNFSSMNDLMKTKMFTEEEAKKIEPYLTF